MVLLVGVLASATGVQAQMSVTNGLALWLRADLGVTTNETGNVTGWADQSGNRNDAAQGEAGMAPRLVDGALNGKPVLRFDGADDFLEVPTSPSIEIAGNISSFFVVKFDDFANYRAVWAKTVANLPRTTDYYLLPGTGVPRLYRGGEGAGQLGSVDGIALRANNYLVVGFEMEGTTLTHYLNSVAVGSGQINAELNDGGTPLKIGTRDDLFTKMKGDIAELLIYDTALSEVDRGAVINYLQTKYNIINLVPSINLTTPANNSTVTGPSNIVVTANASDPDGSIARVDFLVNGQFLASASAAPFRATVTLATPGTVVLTAVAVDNKDGSAVSAPVTVTVTGAGNPSLSATNGLQLWLKADQGVTANAVGEVSEWSDQSGKGNHAGQGDSSMAPLAVNAGANGKPVVRFDGTDDFLEIPYSDSLAITNDIASFFVIRFDDFATFRAVWAKTQGNLPRPTDYYVLPGSGIPRVYRGSEAGIAAVDGARGLRPTNYLVVGFQQAGNLLTHYVNGSAAGSGVLDAVPGDAGGTLRIGTRDDFVTRMKGDLAELLIFDTAQSTDALASLQTYLGTKYGIPIAQLVNAAPAVALDAPTNNTRFTAPTNITITATATDADGSIARVEILAGATVIGAVTTAPYTARLDLPTSGDVVLRAIATDNLGRRSTSAPVNITASAPAGTTLPVTSGLRLWLRADGGVTADNAGVVSSWADFSGNLNHATQLDTTAAPVLVANALNGKPVIRFDGNNDSFEIGHAPSLVLTGDVTSFFVVKIDDFDGFRAVWAKTAANQPRPVDFYTLPTSGIPRLFRGGPGGIGNVDAGEPLTAGNYLVAGFDVAGVTINHYLGDRVIGTGEVPGAVPADAGTPLRIGTRDDQFTRFKGDLAELVIFGEALSTEDRQKLLDYFNAKYFTAVPVGPTLQISRTAGNTITITWSGGGTLEQATDLPGQWSPVAGATTGYSTAITGDRKYFRVRQ